MARLRLRLIVEPSIDLRTTDQIASALDVVMKRHGGELDFVVADERAPLFAWTHEPIDVAMRLLPGGKLHSWASPEDLRPRTGRRRVPRETVPAVPATVED